MSANPDGVLNKTGVFWVFIVVGFNKIGVFF